MNNIAFKINKFVLNYVLNEWEKEDSILFKITIFYIVELMILVIQVKFNISADFYKEIQAHNSIFYNDYNTVMIATLYIDTIFYLPTFLDLRGRI